ncbi:uncharacterized protein J4E92_010470 [Alternaria infectoria]|uniref:uncharacterized protein n=1 Tax=Alternaria infectoria TaxID=45303 RepID=UPI00221F173C|nr:uncharacterized protein J4E92_010470 [Alternaria infectoria]KAI4910541.1 hypothetical protein J4E92_010470 [Alternaria infectoria]
MLLRYALIIAAEMGKASRSRSETLKAMCALEAEKRMGLTGTPLENDYDEVQTLMKWLRIQPWNDIKVFNDYFVTKKPKKTKAKTLRGIRNAILSTSLRACFFPLAIDDTFNGGRLVEFSRHSVRNTRLTLPTAEAAHKKETRPIWGKQKGGKDRERWSDKLRVWALPEVLKARMKVVHPGVAAGVWTPGRSPSSVSIQTAGGGLELVDTVRLSLAQELWDDGEGANLAKDSESKDEYGGAKDFERLGLDLEATMGLAHENIFLDMSHKQARQRLLDETKDDWSSARINMLTQQLVPIHDLDFVEWESLTKGEAYIDMTAKESRKQLLKETENDWHSTRIDKLIEQIFILHEPKSEGKIINTDEFLQTLDVVSNALKATGIEFLEFNGHMSLKERDAMRE